MFCVILVFFGFFSLTIQDRAILTMIEFKNDFRYEFKNENKNIKGDCQFHAISKDRDIWKLTIVIGVFVFLN